MTDTVEMAKIKLAPGRTEADLIAASDHFQKRFLATQPGFIRRELMRDGAGGYLDVIHWRSAADAQAIMEKAMTSEDCRAYFAVMDMDAADPESGVRHLTSLASYG